MDWHDPITFYEKNLRFTPDSYIEHNNLGMAYANAGRMKEAIKEYRRAIAILDRYPQVHSNLANSLKSIGDISGAIEEYEKAIKISPSFFLPYSSLTAIYIEEDDKKSALEIIKRAQAEMGINSNTLYLAGIASYSFKDYDQAIKDFRSILKLDPGREEITGIIDRVKEEKSKYKPSAQ